MREREREREVDEGCFHFVAAAAARMKRVGVFLFGLRTSLKTEKKPFAHFLSFSLRFLFLEQQSIIFLVFMLSIEKNLLHE